MPGQRNIQGKALLLLLVFTANFTIFCHCAANAATAHHHSCCEKKSPGQPCHGVQAVKFNLLEKQLADHIHLSPLPVIHLDNEFLVALPALPSDTHIRPLSDSPKHAPPDMLAFHQRFLI